MQRIRLTYSKDNTLKFISHLELIRAIEKAVRRADIPVAFSQGYNPHMKIDFGIPLQMGVLSDCELMDIYMERWMNPEKVVELLNEALPPGIKVSAYKVLGQGDASIQSAVKAARYRIEFNTDNAKAGPIINDILASKEICITRKTKSGEKRVDIRPLILDIKLNDKIIEATLKNSEAGTLKALEFVALFNGLDVGSIKRVGLLI